MWNPIKTVYCYGTLTVINNDLCPDTSIYVYGQKSGKKFKVEVFDGACKQPYITKTFTDRPSAEDYITTLKGRYPKVVTI